MRHRLVRGDPGGPGDGPRVGHPSLRVRHGSPTTVNLIRMGLAASARVISINTGRSVAAEWAGALKRTAIDKRPVTGPVGQGRRGDPVAVGRLGLAGDEQADRKHHGGYEQAVYTYAREDLDYWVERLGRELPNGTFGENITTGALDISAALIGERWQLGSAVVEVTGPRIPCAVFQHWLGEHRWVRRFSAAQRPGAYLRVTQQGAVAPGDRVVVLDRPTASVTVAESMRAYYGDSALLLRLLKVPGRGPQWDEVARRVLRAAEPASDPA